MASVVSLYPFAESKLDYEVWYRYRNLRYDDGVRVLLDKIRVVKHTPKGVWLAYGSNYTKDGRRFVLKEKGNKRFAHATIEEAKASFIARKQRQIAIHSAVIRDAEQAIKIINGEDLWLINT